MPPMNGKAIYSPLLDQTRVDPLPAFSVKVGAPASAIGCRGPLVNHEFHTYPRIWKNPATAP